MKNILRLLFVLCVIGIAGSAVNAQTFFNTYSGTGSVDSSTLAYSLSYSKRQLQINKDSVTFSYATTYTYSVVCNDTNMNETMNATIETEVHRVLRADNRGRFNGYTFTGFGAEMSRDFIEPCGGSSNYTAIPVSSTRGTLHSHGSGITGILYF